MNTKPKPRFANDTFAYLQFRDSEIPEKVKIQSSHFNAMTRIFMYSFYDKNICVGEIHLKKNKTSKRLRISDCMWDEGTKRRELIEEGFIGNKISMEGIREYDRLPSTIFFRPDKTFIEWIVEYANGRIIVDIGCGSCRVTEKLKDAGARIIGVDPFTSMSNIAAMNMKRLRQGQDIINVLPMRIEECKDLIQNNSQEILMLFARPCHSDFVENALDMKNSNTEALYITVPVNFDKYDDLGEFRDRANLVSHKGISADNETVWSIK